MDIVASVLSSEKTVAIIGIPEFLDRECDCSARKAHNLEFKDVLFVPKNCIMNYVFAAQNLVLQSDKFSFDQKARLQESLQSYVYQTEIPHRFPVYKLNENEEEGDDLNFFIFHDPSIEPEFYPFWDGKNWMWRHIDTGEIMPAGKHDKKGVPEGHPNYLQD
jgi:hypothetical protein